MVTTAAIPVELVPIKCGPETAAKVPDKKVATPVPEVRGSEITTLF